MADDGKYNGFANYETWCSILWIKTDEQAANHWLARARELRDNPPPNAAWTVAERARFSLADEIKACFEDGNPLMDANSVYSDLLSTALGRVNWPEIADHLLKDVDKSAKTSNTPP